MKNDSLEALHQYAEEVRKAQYDYSHIFESLGHGLEVVFDGVVTWTFDVKVRRPWRLLGIVTDEKHQIFQRGIRTHIVTATLADELINPKLIDRFHWPRSFQPTTFRLKRRTKLRGHDRYMIGTTMKVCMSIFKF